MRGSIRDVPSTRMEPAFSGTEVGISDMEVRISDMLSGSCPRLVRKFHTLRKGSQSTHYFCTVCGMHGQQKIKEKGSFKQSRPDNLGCNRHWICDVTM